MEKKDIVDYFVMATTTLLGVAFLVTLELVTRPKNIKEEVKEYVDKDGIDLNNYLINNFTNMILKDQPGSECTSIVSLGIEEDKTFFIAEVANETPLVAKVSLSLKSLDLENNLINLLNNSKDNNKLTELCTYTISYKEEVLANETIKEKMNAKYFNGKDYKMVLTRNSLDLDTYDVFATWKELPICHSVSYVELKDEIKEDNIKRVDSKNHTLTNCLLRAF